MSNVTEAVLEYILPRLAHAERILADAQSAASPNQGYQGFKLALKVIRECRRAIKEEPTRDSTVALGILNKARAALAQIADGAAASSASEARKLIEESAVILQPTA